MKGNNTAHLLSTATAWEKHDAAIFSGSISWQPFIKYVQFPDYKRPMRSDWPEFTLSYQKGIPGLLSSKTDYDKWRISMFDEFSMGLLGSVKYNLATGGFLNTSYVSIPDLNHLYGNRGIGLANPYLQSFQFAQYYEFSNKEKLYLEGHAEYHLNGLLTNKIPLFRRLNYYLVVGSNSYYATDKLYYAEAFVGLENIGYKVARLFRVDFVQSWDSNNGRNSGIRIGINSDAFVMRPSATGSEW